MGNNDNHEIPIVILMLNFQYHSFAKKSQKHDRGTQQ